MKYPVIEIRQPGTAALWVIVRDRLVVGRDCDGILLRDDHASRQHIELNVEDSKLTVTDLESTNGTLLNGLPLEGSKPFLQDDVVVIGRTELRQVLADLNSPLETIPTAVSSPTTVTMIAEQMIGEEINPDDFKNKEGTVTIVFSDIERSTEMTARLGDQRWLILLNEHNRLFKECVSAHNGTIIKSQGDGFMLSFMSVRSAMECAIEIQRSINTYSEHDPDLAFKIRVGVHTGEAIHTLDGDIFGRHVVMAARIANAAKGGQILASSLVKELASGSIDLKFGDAHSIAIKGLEPVIVHEICWRQHPNGDTAKL